MMMMSSMSTSRRVIETSLKHDSSQANYVPEHPPDPKRQMSMTEQNLEIPTQDGLIDALLVRPDSADPLPAVINLTDGLGFRPAFAEQSKRIAERGYVVLTPNIFYRTSKPPVFPFEPDFAAERTQKRFAELKAPLTPAAMARDGSACVDFLASQPFVSSGPVGVIGFCFAGKFALEVAAARPDRIAAGASFHGGGLFTDTIDSPHLVLPRIKARLYFGHASKDAGMNAEQIEKFEWALLSWSGSYESEVYEAKHGWMIPGREVYDPQNAERGFEKLMELLDETLQAAEARR
jgi:carboxymethylenebutenolidase